MSSVVIAGDTSGSITLQAPSVAGTTTLTLPSTSGTVITGTGGVTSVDNGGTGSNTLTANNVLLGNGTSAVQFVAPGSNGNLLTSNGTTWTSAAAPSSTPTTAQVLSATAGATQNAVGTYNLLLWADGNVTIGSNYSSSLQYANAGGGGYASPGGTWKALSNTTSGLGGGGNTALFLRIA